jgi:chemotaxis protein histidine kinase CheA
MSCEEAYEWMQRDLDGDLDDVEKAKLMQHQSICRDCASLYERLSSLSTHLAQLPMVEPPINIVESILPELDRIDRERQMPPFVQEQAATLEKAPYQRSPKAMWYRYVGGATAAGLLLSAIVFTLDGTETRQSAFSSAQLTQIQDSTRMKSKDTALAMGEQHDSAGQKQLKQMGKSAGSQPHASDETEEINPSSNASSSQSAVVRSESIEEKTQDEPKSSGVDASNERQQESKAEAKQSQEPANESSSGQSNSEQRSEDSAKPMEKASGSEVAIAQAPDTADDSKKQAEQSAPSLTNGKVTTGAAVAFVAKDQKAEKKSNDQSKVESQAYKPAGKPSPEGNLFITKLDNCLLVRNDNGGIEFVTHTWDDVYNVSYQWVGAKKMVYTLEYKAQPDGEKGPALQTQVWLIDLEKNIERRMN